MSERELLQPSGVDADLIAASHEAYRSAGLRRDIDKGFGFSEKGVDVPVGSQDFICWGTQAVSFKGLRKSMLRRIVSLS
eukprot:3446537-Karenia_brevis.AAC.1